jgi:hypothetical protein
MQTVIFFESLDCHLSPTTKAKTEKIQKRKSTFFGTLEES